MVALLAAVTIGPLAIWLLQGLGGPEMTLGRFVALKAGFGMVLAVLVTPVVAWRALMDSAIASRGTTGPPRETV